MSSYAEEDVKRIARKLEKIVNGKKEMDEAMALLKTLSGLPVTVEILASTRVGMICNELRKKTSDENIAKRAKSLIKEWKNLLDKDKGGSTAADGELPGMPRNDSLASNLSDFNSRDSTSNGAACVSAGGDAARHTSFPPKQSMADEMRIKCAKMIADALRSGDLPDGTLDPDETSVKIENQLFLIHRSTSDKYKHAIRSRVFNLRDKKNPALRETVLTGVIPPDRFAKMTSEEMASDDVKQLREKFTKESIDEHQMAMNEGTPSDMFKCGKCRNYNCTYTQVQTRSADEPMTTFVFCRDCGNRWKFC